jgi:anti-sigma factor RsiW
MSEHLPNDVLHAFVQGELGDDDAVICASHIDRCAHCATRAAALEPLAAAFASIHDPEVPADLVPSVLRALESPQVGTREVVLGAAMLIGALGLAVSGRDPLSLITELSALLRAAQVVASSLGQLSSVATIWAALVAMAFGAAATWLLARPAHHGAM